jgi:hypothetical protein
LGLGVGGAGAGAVGLAAAAGAGVLRAAASAAAPDSGFEPAAVAGAVRLGGTAVFDAGEAGDL